MTGSRYFGEGPLLSREAHAGRTTVHGQKIIQRGDAASYRVLVRDNEVM